MDNEPKPIGDLGGGEIILGAKIMPIYAGALDAHGNEPMSDPAYQRGIIKWDAMPNGEVWGRFRVMVPMGTWTWLIYTFHPTKPSFYAVERIVHPLTLNGHIDVDCANGNAIEPWNQLAGLP